MILVPVKNSKNAKQRLSEVLDGASRIALAQAMLRDVLETLASWRDQSLPEGCCGIALVTSDSYAVDLAFELKLEVIGDETNPGETGAIEMATRLCEERGIGSTLVIPADIPLIAGWELDEIYAKAPEEGSVLVPAADRRGTNAALRCPAGLFPLRFGNDSFKPHVAAAQASGKQCVILSLPGIALDVDRPEDLQKLMLAAGNGHAQQLARQWDLSGYPMAANE
jgi:2-phospho-L-lactate/phosphoenolpyruvate guanylyltransferase